MLKKLKHLGEYDPKNLDKTNSKKETLISAEKIYNNRDNVISSNIIEVIRPVLNFLFFFTIRFHKYKKALKSTKRH